jgi:hypothetical protein
MPAVDATVMVGQVRPRVARRKRLCGHGGARRGGAGAAMRSRCTKLQRCGPGDAVAVQHAGGTVAVGGFENREWRRESG